MKTRFVFSACCMLVAMTMATGAFAQAVFTVSSGNQPRGRLNGHTELAGGVTLAKLSGSNVGDDGGTVVIDYGVPITNVVGDGTNNTIDVDICGTPGIATTAVVTKNTITVTVPVDDCDANDETAGSDAIDVSGVRLSLAGSGQTGIVATVSSTGGVRLPSGSNQVSVINSIVDELVNDGVTVETLTLIRHTGSPESGEYFKLLIEENAVDSFAGAALDLDFSGLGTGMTLTLDAWVSTKDDLEKLKPTEFLLIDDDPDTIGEGMDESAGSILTNKQLAFEGGTGSSDNRIATITVQNNSSRVLMGLGDALTFYDEEGVAADNPATTVDERTIMGGSLDPAKVDVIVIRGKIALATTGDNAVELPLTLDIMATATVAPIGAAIPPKTGNPERGIPRFASDPSPSVTVIDSTSDQTTLQVAYVLSEGLYNTGIAVANMTSGKSAQTGAVHFDLYMNGQRIGPATADYSYSTSMLGPQSTMSMLLTEVLTGAGHTGRFGGYMIITTDFNEADAGVFISDFAGFTAAATVREIP